MSSPVHWQVCYIEKIWTLLKKPSYISQLLQNVAYKYTESYNATIRNKVLNKLLNLVPFELKSKHHWSNFISQHGKIEDKKNGTFSPEEDLFCFLLSRWSRMLEFMCRYFLQNSFLKQKQSFINGKPNLSSGSDSQRGDHRLV